MMVMGNVEHVYLNTNDHYRADLTVDTRDYRFIRWCQERYPLHRYERLAPLMHLLRSVKSKQEIALIQTACEITAKAFGRVLRFVKPGVREYEIEAEYAHEFLRRGSRGFAYEPIIASGANSCVLHYIVNEALVRPGFSLRTLTLPDLFQDHDDPHKQYDLAGLNAADIAQVIESSLVRTA